MDDSGEGSEHEKTKELVSDGNEDYTRNWTKSILCSFVITIAKN